MSEFYLQTLEGAPRYLGEVPQERRDMVRSAFDVYWQMTTDVKDLTERFYKVFNFLTRVYTDEEIYTLVNRPDVKPEAAEAWRLFRINQGRKASAAQAAQSASEAEAARIAALQQQAQEEAEAEREALDEQRRIAAQQASAVEEAEEIINEGNSMAQNIPARDETDVNISTQLVTSGSEFTVVDETPETIAYVDEAGELHVEQKQKSGLGWLVAATAAFFLLT